MLEGKVGQAWLTTSSVLINFINIAKRRNFSATSQASDVQTTRYGNWNK